MRTGRSSKYQGAADTGHSRHHDGTTNEYVHEDVGRVALQADTYVVLGLDMFSQRSPRFGAIETILLRT
jgi:hypothetical protein